MFLFTVLETKPMALHLWSKSVYHGTVPAEYGTHKAENFPGRHKEAQLAPSRSSEMENEAHCVSGSRLHGLGRCQALGLMVFAYTVTSTDRMERKGGKGTKKQLSGSQKDNLMKQLQVNPRNVHKANASRWRTALRVRRILDSWLWRYPFKNFAEKAKCIPSFGSNFRHYRRKEDIYFWRRLSWQIAVLQSRICQCSHRPRKWLRIP